LSSVLWTAAITNIGFSWRFIDRPQSHAVPATENGIAKPINHHMKEARYEGAGQ